MSTRYRTLAGMGSPMVFTVSTTASGGSDDITIDYSGGGTRTTQFGD